MSAGGEPALLLRAGGDTLRFDGSSEPLLMGIVNATPDSFSDSGAARGPDQLAAVAVEQVLAGARIIDVGGESAITGRPPVAVAEEIRRVVPVIELLLASWPREQAGAPLISVDTYKPQVAQAAIRAGATIVNDVSGLRDMRLASVCAETGAALVIMHTAAPPKQRLQDPGLYEDVVASVTEFLAERIELAAAHGLAREQILLDPGPDFAKTPAQTIALLHGIETIAELGRPLLMAISRKDFIGALLGRRPGERLAGTLAAVAWAADAGAQVLRVHDVAAVADFLRVRAALRGELEVALDLELRAELRHERG